jgi:hypothetical protein
MSASTIEHLSHQGPVRPASSEAARAPASGSWDIGPGQSLVLAARALRTRTVSARVHTGTLHFTDDLVDSVVELTVLVPDDGCRITFATHVTRLLSVDTWQADGTATTASGARPVSMRLRNNGIFRQRGRKPSLWLTIEASIEIPELGSTVGRRRAGAMKLTADLNLNPR